MLFRHTLAIAAVAVGLVDLPDRAHAQFASPPYSYPPGGYRGVPDQDGVMILDPNTDASRTRSRLGRTNPSSDGAPYPYDTRNSYDARTGQNVEQGAPQRGVQQASPADDPYPIPSYQDPTPSYEAPRGPFGHYGDPARGIPPAAMEPPGLIPPQSVPGAPSQAGPVSRPNTVAALPPEDQPEEGEPKELPPQFKRQIVPYETKQPPGTIVIDTASTYLYLVQGNGTALRYGIGVGREGFTWAGTEKISRLAEWPDWHPPSEMIERQPYLPRFMAGGPGNPLGARALYLGKTIYRIHGTNQPSTIGKFVSSGCIRMLNEDVEDLYTRVKIGTRVVVLPGGPPSSASNLAAPATR